MLQPSTGSHDEFQKAKNGQKYDSGSAGSSGEANIGTVIPYDMEYYNGSLFHSFFSNLFILAWSGSK